MKRTSIGGQAVIEGVMMKNGKKCAIAVRKPDHTIEVKTSVQTSIAEKYKILKLPIIRGVVNFIESMVVGIQTLTYSASFYEEEEEESSFDRWFENTFKEKGESILMGITVCISLVLSIGIFMILPYLLTGFLENQLKSHTLVLALEGVVRIGIFLGYIVLISRMKDIQRVFMYHGAEHKTINCLEHGEDLTPENVKKYSRLHKRCGTSFLFIVMFISIFFFFFIRVDSILLKVVFRLLLIPVIAGVSYEFIRFAGKNDSGLVGILSKPGMMLQKLTTREPDLSMIEVAIKSVEGVIDWKEYVEAMRKGELED
ncbi:MAG: DUF1385 domain-containing protein [Anaerostipes sp.]|uniref:DUF1385 domain-containing protein n=1 Tax=Anaerostipes sp. 992a TaxID=1261637 RepID=UPI0009523F44|nr:DUF1385 domain-containing protein [Anaerostipes sp. 992a]MCI5952339.1 DUF1385 domain-containing protein [Anaerostipes sp.]MDD5968091.1 DUF1385 domain-containing protein [Anaerostipes sp.]OLR62449.1 hypothetical protein BHF69_07005 [Anaerostipes sp. 992a]